MFLSMILDICYFILGNALNIIYSIHYTVRVGRNIRLSSMDRTLINGQYDTPIYYFTQNDFLSLGKNFSMCMKFLLLFMDINRFNTYIPIETSYEYVISNSLFL